MLTSHPIMENVEGAHWRAIKKWRAVIREGGASKDAAEHCGVHSWHK